MAADGTSADAFAGSGGNHLPCRLYPAWLLGMIHDGVETDD
jgi:hypothetical protein